MNVESNTPTGYRNWIRINDNGGSQDIAHADQDTGWYFPVSYTSPLTLPERATILAGPSESILARGDETIKGVGQRVSFAWRLGGSTAFRLTADPYNKVKGGGDRGNYPIRTVLVRPNDYLFQLDYTMTKGVGTWDIEISVTGNPEAVFTLSVDEQPHTLEQGKSSYQKLVAQTIYVSAENLKGEVEIGYTLVQTG
ncbi:MAG TPA: hypothetical protein VF656_04845 [Pyrinomonadaceae bacterium]|jgi:hypothetical protein